MPERAAVEATDVIPLVIVAGFFGVGKTRVIRTLRTGASAAVLFEDRSNPVDALLAGEEGDLVRAAGAACFCCSGLAQDWITDLEFILRAVDRGDRPAPGRIFLEASGATDPAALARELAAQPYLVARTGLAIVLTVVRPELFDQLTPSVRACVSRQIASAHAIVLNGRGGPPPEQNGFRRMVGAPARVPILDAEPDLISRLKLETIETDSGRSAEASASDKIAAAWARFRNARALPQCEGLEFIIRKSRGGAAVESEAHRFREDLRQACGSSLLRIKAVLPIGPSRQTAIVLNEEQEVLVAGQDLSAHLFCVLNKGDRDAVEQLWRRLIRYWDKPTDPVEPRTGLF